MFLVDEVGQFIGKETSLMLNLQTITENLGTVCGGRAWVVVTSQEDMEAVLGELRSSTANDFSKIQGRFRTRLSLSGANADEVIQALEAERQNGGRVYGQVMPRCFDLNMRLSETSMLLYALPSWKAIMDSPLDERRTKFADPALRDGLVREMSEARGMSGALPFLSVGHVVSKANEQYQGRHLAEIAETEGKQIGEVILDLSNADNLETEFQLKGVINADKAAVAKLINHPMCHFGASDAGAHITQFCGTGDTTHLLEHYVRETGQMSLERAVHRMTGEVAKDWGIADRGTLEPGKAADLVLFDPDRVSVGDEEFVDDFPGEARRYVRRAEGYAAVIVNGEIVLEDGQYTDARPGQIV